MKNAFLDRIIVQINYFQVTQYSCDYPNLAPDGCTQYFFGETTGTVQSYNFEGGTHLANQNQNMCIRRERGICKQVDTIKSQTKISVSNQETKFFLTSYKPLFGT